MELVLTPFWNEILACSMGEGGLEPPTSTLSVLRSNQLSYSPERVFKERNSRM